MTPLIGVFIAPFAGLLAPNWGDRVRARLDGCRDRGPNVEPRIGSRQQSGQHDRRDELLGRAADHHWRRHRCRSWRLSVADEAGDARWLVARATGVLRTAGHDGAPRQHADHDGRTERGRAGARQHSNPPRGRGRTHPVDRCVGPGHRCDGIDRACRRSRARCAR